MGRNSEGDFLRLLLDLCEREFNFILKIRRKKTGNVDPLKRKDASKKSGLPVYAFMASIQQHYVDKIKMKLQLFKVFGGLVEIKTFRKFGNPV